MELSQIRAARTHDKIPIDIVWVIELEGELEERICCGLIQSKTRKTGRL